MLMLAHACSHIMRLTLAVYIRPVVVVRVRGLEVLDISILGYLHMVKVGKLDMVIVGPLQARPGRTGLGILVWVAHTCGTSTSALSDGISTVRT